VSGWATTGSVGTGGHGVDGLGFDGFVTKTTYRHACRDPLQGRLRRDKNHEKQENYYLTRFSDYGRNS